MKAMVLREIGLLGEERRRPLVRREKSIQTVANVTRSDVRRCLELAEAIPLNPTVSLYPLEAANEALLEMKRGGIRGAKVLSITPEP